MRITITKGASSDTIAVARAGLAEARFTFPKKGPTPHDAVHFFVERELGLARGFWGLVAGGMDPAKVGALAAAGGHASASRAQIPDGGIVELLQAERLVECFEAESWSGASDNEGIRNMAGAGWRASHVPPLALPDERIAAIRSAIGRFAADWAALAQGASAQLEWGNGDG